MIYFKPLPANKTQFIEFWSRLYKPSEYEHIYVKNIGKRLTKERILNLYRWKNYRKLSKHKRKSVLINFVDRLDVLSRLSTNADVRKLLTSFSKGGPIWRIFWLHCWQPDRFPIYDQHVHRAMAFIKTGIREEIPKQDSEKLNSCIQAYLPFHNAFGQSDKRSVDKALWTFGKFLKEYNFPMEDQNGE